jgi:murein DD-endopeptidase MepM/ murein hydrolase activator NlpD
MFQAVPRAPRPALLFICLLAACALTGGGSAADGACSPDASTCSTTTETSPTPTESTPTTTTTETTQTDSTPTTTAADPDDLVPNRRGSTAVAPPDEIKPPKTTETSPQAATPPVSAGLGPQLRTPALGGGPYVFPVYGPVQFSDTFGAPRADVSWHHGGDIFAPLGSPILAVADGTLFSVGWNQIGGNRVWLRDREGNYFYYAHLAAFSTLAVEGATVRAGDVIGFVGNTGDAAGTPYHLHFEIHPVGLLGLGYDGAVNPTSYLERWQRARDLEAAAPAGVGWSRRPAPAAGAILLAASDISSADGLEPGSLRRALTEEAAASTVAMPVSAAPIGQAEPDRSITAVRDFDGTLPDEMLAASVWDLVARCESNGRWSTNTGNGFFGGLQFEPGTWRAFGGELYAHSAHMATRDQQITVAQRVLTAQGWLAWPACSARLGLR